MTRHLHWREYASELLCLGLFMISAASFATLLQHPASAWSLGATPGVWSRAAMGLAMGLTAMSIVYSPWGQRSGAHMNPAVTLTFLRLGKIAPRDAACYIAAQFVAGFLGIVLGTIVLGGGPAHPSVNYVATTPGPEGVVVAFAAEVAISFALMFVILYVSNHHRFARFTGVCAGVLIVLYITIESPLSGMSMNPARSLGPALLAGTLDSVWIYFLAPVAGMLLAAEAYLHSHGTSRVRCAKLHHAEGVPCIFRCGFSACTQPSMPVSVIPANEVSI